ncbi:hypothetical protein DY000_02047357 [Brassica cretica]|uniref:Uncharacterized protein n=1 Tax=Brassica cretica TaxID=69181 RepID=A0ABQ7ERU8_BRACR|nr:hypothetical protein DY000_02047357 [Brassica cretica]
MVHDVLTAIYGGYSPWDRAQAREKGLSAYLGVVRWIAGPRGSGSVESGSVTYGVKLCRVLRDWLVTFHCGLSVDWTESCTGWMRVVNWIWGCRAECVLSDQDMISDLFWDASKAGALSNVIRFSILIELARYDGWESMEIARMEYIPLPHKNSSDGYIPHLGDELGYPLEVRKHNVNQKQQAKEQPLRSKLMNYARGRWNPLIDPSSPISGATSKFQRVKLANRWRCRTEVLSFDGRILSPVYEAATRTIDENAPTTTTKADTEKARQPVALIADATAASAILSPK